MIGITLWTSMKICLRRWRVSRCPIDRPTSARLTLQKLTPKRPLAAVHRLSVAACVKRADSLPPFSVLNHQVRVLQEINMPEHVATHGDDVGVFAFAHCADLIGYLHRY